MAWSYDNRLTTDKDKVRFFVGDTDPTDPLFQDEEVGAMVTSEGSPLKAAAAIAEAQAAKYGRLVSMSVDGLSVQYTDLAKNFSTLAARLRAREADESGGMGVPSVFGTSISGMTSVDQNTDRVPSQFKIGQFDNPPREGGSTDAIPFSNRNPGS